MKALIFEAACGLRVGRAERFFLRVSSSRAYHRHVRSTIVLLVLPAVLAIGKICMAAQSGPATAPAVQIGASASRMSDIEIARHIAQLGDVDPVVRRIGADSLVRAGAAARPAVLAAARGDDPQIADAAAQVLRSLPWWVPDDPPEVKKQLESYGQESATGRITIVAQLDTVPGSEPALLRLLSDELNEDVCWQVETELVERPDVATFTAARRFDLQTARPAALVLAGRAWLTPLSGGRSASLIDRNRALAMLGRAVELEAVAPTNDNGELDFAFDQLAASALERHQYDQAAMLRRKQCKRIGVTRSSFPSPFFELLILHCDYGPLAGYGDDLEAYQAYVAAPESLFILSQLYARQGQTLMSQTLAQAALTASQTQLSSEETRSHLASFLIRHGWNDLAAEECWATLSHAAAQPDTDDVNARLLLSDLAAMRGDEAEAADQLRKALDDYSVCEGELTISGGSREIKGAEAEQVLRVELAKHALHAAQAKGDSAEVGRQLDELLRLGPDDEEAVLDLVPELRARGRQAEADKLFQSVYMPLQARVNAGDADPTLLNDIAWLCARCNEHVDEALELSNRAVMAEPDSAAYLDTNAEAHFRAGQAAEAARLETLALKYQPGDKFMEGQLKRFQAGVKGN